jgi:mannose-6-phosphate isomerase-like protein (cupin superfamily)
MSGKAAPSPVPAIVIAVTMPGGYDNLTSGGRAIVGERRRTDMTVLSNRMCALLIMLGVVAAVGESVPAHAEDTAQITLNPETLKFTPIPDMPACASAAILRGKPRWGAASVLLKLASGCRVPWHWHTANETLVVISGRGTVAMKDGPPLRFLPGAYASLPSHHQHKASCSRTCLLFNDADAAFDIHYVNASGEEISADDALKPSAEVKGKKK